MACKNVRKKVNNHYWQMAVYAVQSVTTNSRDTAEGKGRGKRLHGKEIIYVYEYSKYLRMERVDAGRTPTGRERKGGSRESNTHTNIETSVCVSFSLLGGIIDLHVSCRQLSVCQLTAFLLPTPQPRVIPSLLYIYSLPSLAKYIHNRHGSRRSHHHLLPYPLPHSLCRL